MIRMKPHIDVLAMLKASGYSTYRIAQERIFGQSTMTKFRRHGRPSWDELDTVCNLCSCSPWDVVEYIPDAPRDVPQPTNDKP